MFKVPYEDILAKVVKKTGKSQAEVEELIKEKQTMLSGLITRQGAAQIVASEQGINIYEEYTGKIPIEKIVAGMRTVETVGKIVRIYPVKTFVTKQGREGQVASVILADETGSIRLVLWNELTALLDEVSEGDILHLKGAAARPNRDQVELQIFSPDQVRINPDGEKLENVAAAPATPQREPAKRMAIQDIMDNAENIEILGNIVTVFDPRFFTVCPQCNKRVREENGGNVCPQHGNVEPVTSAVMNLVVDDGTGSIRTSLFKNQINALLSFSKHDILYYQDHTEEWQECKNELLGEYVRAVGRAVKSEAFDRIEFRTQLVFLNPDPEQELSRLNS